MKEEELQQFVKDTKLYIYDNFNLNAMTDAELEEAVEALVNQQLQGYMCQLNNGHDRKAGLQRDKRFWIIGCYHGDDDITEVMINGPEDIFIEKKAACKNWTKALKAEADWKILYRK